MEILHEFGINPVLLIAQIINFGIIFWVLKKFLYKPILTMLKERQKEIKKGIKDAEDARILLEQTTQKEKEVLKKAQAESRSIIEEAKGVADTIIKEARVESRKVSEQLITDAKAQITLETKLAEKQLSMHVTQLSVEMLEKSLSGILTAEEEETVVKQALIKMKGKAN